MRFDSRPVARIGQMSGERGASGFAEANVRDDTASEKSGDAPSRAVEKLVRNKKLERRQILAQRSHGAHRNNSLGTKHFQCTDVRAIVDLARRKAVAAPVTR